MAEDREDRMPIGEVLKSTRTRKGLDIRTVEERTKIRIKYLRALENEDWDVLPGAVYAKGFLRTYGQLLDLDGDALVDQYRRQVEAPGQLTYPVAAADGVLERHRLPGEPPGGPGWGVVLGIAVAAGAIFLLVIGLAGSGDPEGERAERREARQERREARRQERRREARREERQAAGGPVTLRLVTEAAVHVCLVGDAERPLIDGQVLPAGVEERFEARRFRLAFPSGYDVDQFRLFVGGERQRLPGTAGPAAYRISGPGRVRAAREPGPGCP